MSSGNAVTVRFHTPPADLQPFFTSFYHTTIDPGDTGELHDCLHPEWAGLRFFSPNLPHCWFDAGGEVRDAGFIATGPTIHPLHFIMPQSRIWGIGLLPLGWARFVAQPASDFANWVCDGRAHPATARFVPLADSLFDAEADEMAELARIVAFFRDLAVPPSHDEARITAIHAALVDPATATVAELVERVCAGQRTVERLCRRHFGFPAKLLLRRQRFMRSLAQFMLDPSLKWVGAMDGHYHDQAQFVRDFREFMGVTPGEYSSRPHPVLERFLHARLKAHRAPVQTLDRPAG